jgi:signal transduction histidine kinase
VNDLLAAADVTEAVVADKPVALNPIVEAAIESLSVIATDRGLTITFTPQDQYSVFIPAPRVQRCVIALLDNAISFSPRGGTIRVTIADDKKSSLSLRVRDQGPGIQGIDPARIFDRFARSGTAIDGGGSPRTGFGIGLALVRETLERFGGSASVVATSSAGTEIELLIPRAAEVPYDVP